MTAPRTFYDILGVAEDLPQEALAAELERQWQKYAGDGEMRPLLTLCRQSLGTEETRSAYDRQLRLQRARRQRDENSRDTAENPRPGISRLALALLLPLAGFGLWKYGLPQFASTPQPAHPASPVAPVSVPSPQNPTQAAAPANAPASTTVVETSAPANPVVAPNVSPQWQRPAKKPGFDAQYLAWSVFTIRQSRRRVPAC